MTVVYQDSDYFYESIDSPLDEEAAVAIWPVEMPPAYTDFYSDTIHRRMLLILVLAIGLVFTLGTLALRREPSAQVQSSEPPAAEAASVDEAALVTGAAGSLAPLFTREVQHWAPQIIAWSAEHGLDPNMVATVMQIESCGDPNAVSSAGAQGLFQVMPFHFEAGEQMQDPNTNAYRGLRYLVLGMSQTGGDTSLTFAGYNGGHGTAARGWETWPAETQRYHRWSTGIYADAQAGSASSETLNQWLAAGGAGLCQQAAARLGIQ